MIVVIKGEVIMKKIVLILFCILLVGCGKENNVDENIIDETEKVIDVQNKGNYRMSIILNVPSMGVEWEYFMENEKVLFFGDKTLAEGEENFNNFYFGVQSNGVSEIVFKYDDSSENVYELIYTFDVDDNMNIKLLKKEGNYILNELPEPLIINNVN